MKKDPFENYIISSDQNVREKSYAWHTAIGLQQVDKLKPSSYLLNMAIDHIEGRITIDEAEEMLDTYYRNHPEQKDRTEEADKVSQRIAKILSEEAFTFSPVEYIAIHRKLFVDIYPHAGKIRDYNITKKEWILDGETVLYGTASELQATLAYDLSEEKKFSYANLSMDETIKHLAFFVSRLWQIHIFAEGNTRTTAVFFIKYLRTLGFKAENDIFAENAWYFRNALVRANYNNMRKGIFETTAFLEAFLRNLLLDEKNELKNRFLHISGSINNMDVKSEFELQKVDSQSQKPDFDPQKVDFEHLQAMISKKLRTVNENISEKTIHTIALLLQQAGCETIFDRTQIEKWTGLKKSRASELIKILLKSELIEKVIGKGKGKYRVSKKVLINSGAWITL